MNNAIDVALVCEFEQHRERLRRSIDLRLDPRLKVRLDADDILQQVFMLASAKCQRAAAPIDEYVWWYGIARDCLIEEWRKNSRQIRDVAVEVPLPTHSSVLLGEHLLRGQLTPSKDASQRELRELVEQTINSMDNKEQDILWMRLFEDLRHDEIAAVLRITVANATKRYSRALLRLKNLLGDECI